MVDIVCTRVIIAILNNYLFPQCLHTYLQIRYPRRWPNLTLNPFSCLRTTTASHCTWKQIQNLVHSCIFDNFYYVHSVLHSICTHLSILQTPQALSVSGGLHLPSLHLEYSFLSLIWVAPYHSGFSSNVTFLKTFSDYLLTLCLTMVLLSSQHLSLSFPLECKFFERKWHLYALLFVLLFI